MVDEQSTVAPVIKRGPALLGRLSLYGSIAAIPAWIGTIKVFAIHSNSSGAPFMFAMFFLPAASCSALAVGGGYVATSLLKNGVQDRARSIALMGTIVGFLTLMAIPLMNFIVGRFE